MDRARILVLQHIACEHPGIFRDYLAEDDVAWDAVELDAGEAIPEYRAALERALGADGLARIDADCRRHMPGFNAVARGLYRNLMAPLAAAASADAVRPIHIAPAPR